ncbi:MAG: META domain-containing protein [Prevotellaceae bacterium]|nr:META domain-containing protein [Prevotellaceae bacterium]
MKQLTLTIIAALALVACGSSRHARKQGGIIGSWTIERAMSTSTEGGEEQAFISFGSDGKFNGNASVNLFFGSYTLSGSSLKLENVGMTRRLGASMDVERAVTEGLNAVEQVSLSGDRAYLMSAQGDTLLWLLRQD